MHPRVRSVLLAAVAGVLYFVGFVGFGVWPLVFLFPAVLLWAIEGRRPLGALALGALTGFVGMCGGYYWLIHLLTEFASLPLPLAVLGYVLVNLYQGLLWGVVAGLVAGARAWLGVHPAWALPVAIIFAEWVFPLLFPSFVAASFLSVPILNQIADLGGPYLVDGLIGLVAGGLYSLTPPSVAQRGRSLRPVIAAGAATALTLIYGGVRMAQVEAKTAPRRTLSVALIQANLGAKDKTLKRREFLLRHQEMSRAAIEARPEVELIVWRRPPSTERYRSDPRTWAALSPWASPVR